MFCPNCSAQVNEALKFCKRCGTNLLGVREAMTRPGGDTVNWSKFWVADLEDKRERRKSITGEEKRYNEIKAGVITAVAGLGMMIFLRIFMPAIAQSEPDGAEILLRVWVAGIVPFLIGLSIIFNGVFITKRALEARDRPKSEFVPTSELLGGKQAPALPESALPLAPEFSVVEPTTRRIPEPADAPAAREPK